MIQISIPRKHEHMSKDKPRKRRPTANNELRKLLARSVASGQWPGGRCPISHVLLSDTDAVSHCQHVKSGGRRNKVEADKRSVRTVQRQKEPFVDAPYNKARLQKTHASHRGHRPQRRPKEGNNHITTWDGDRGAHACLEADGKRSVQSRVTGL